jgi:hypothetical protein
MSAQVLSREQAEKMLISKATSDETFRAALLADPKSAIGGALGITIPADLSIKVIEETPRSVVLVLPARGDGALTDADLRDIVGGAKEQQQQQSGDPAWDKIKGFFGTDGGAAGSDAN